MAILHAVAERLLLPSEEVVMDEQIYEPPMLAEVGEFSEDTLGFFDGFDEFGGLD